jgi:hypothetical protein
VRPLFRLTAILVAALTLILAVLLLFRPPLKPLALHIPPAILPGQIIEARLEYKLCREEYPSTPTGSCVIRTPELVYLSYDPVTRRIYRVYYRMPAEIVLGDLIVLWGTPKGVLRYTYFQYIVWTGHRMVFANVPATMTRGTIYLVYDEDEVGLTAWKGFQSR